MLDPRYSTSDPPGAGLDISALSKAFDKAPVVDDVSLGVEPGSLFCLLGPSGCGKTTLLRLIAGYHAADAGVIRLGGRDITPLGPEHRGIGMVFQHYALFPHLSARDNVAFGLAARGVTRADRRRQAEAMLDRVGLSAAECRRRPRGLSGGQQQRVALARALVIEPKLLLLDEPMANLDRRLREQMREEIRDLQRRTGVTTVFVTHDQEEALSLADRIGVMMDGGMAQIGTPDEIYNRPIDARLARFLGDANLLAVQSSDAGGWQLPGGLVIGAHGRAAPSQVMIRPERIRPAAEHEQGMSAQIVSTTFLGADRIIDMRLADDTALRMRARLDEYAQISPGDTLRVAVDDDAVWPLA